MKFCPVCKTRYDEEILRFCTKDGTPLVEEGEPNFTALPSESDAGEETVIRRKTPPPIPATAQPVPDFGESEQGRISSPRIVIPMGDEEAFDEEPLPPPRREPVRARTTPSPRMQPPPQQQKSNTAMVVFLTILGTVVVLAGGAGVVWFLSSQNADANQNTNYNVNMNSLDINLNQNVSNALANFNYAVNSNANSNANANANANANLKTPSPTPTRSPTPTPDQNANIGNIITPNSNTMSTPANTRPSPTNTPRQTPRPSPSPSLPSGRPVNAGVLNNRAVNLPKPAYPPNARQMRATGRVIVQVLVDEAGNVTSAKATSGNPMLRSSAEAAARQSKFQPVRINNQPVPASGVVLYNFVD